MADYYISAPKTVALAAPNIAAGFVDPRWFGAVGDGKTNDLAAFQRAVATGLPLSVTDTGQPYLIDGVLDVSAIGLICGTGTLSFTANPVATGNSRIEIRGLTIRSNGAGFFFTGCNQVLISDVTFIGTTASAAYLSAQGIWTKGCGLVLVDGCSFTDYNDAVFLADNAGTHTKQAKVTRCTFALTGYGNFFSYPAQVYQYFCDDLVVDDCDFENVFPGNPANASPIGYCVYEGDGACISTIVSNCRYRTTAARGDTAFVLTSTSAQVIVCNNQVRAENPAGSLYLARIGACGQSLDISHNQGYRADILVAEDAACVSVIVSFNQLQYAPCLSGAAIRCGAGTASVTAFQAKGNFISRPAQGGIFVNAADWFDFEGNSVVDANTANTIYSPGNNEFAVSGLCAYGPVFGRVAGNYVANIVPHDGKTARAGHANFGYATVYAANSVQITADNRWAAMTVAPTLNGFTAANRPGAGARWQTGEAVWYEGSAAKAAPGEVCVKSASTTLTGAAPAGATTLAVASTITMAAGDTVAVVLTSGALHSTTVRGVTDATHVVLAAGLASGASAGTEIRTNLFRPMAPLG